nr:MAG TPA: hypothetical protein [Crassvirales sp.]
MARLSHLASALLFRTTFLLAGLHSSFILPLVL